MTVKCFVKVALLVVCCPALLGSRFFLSLVLIDILLFLIKVGFLIVLIIRLRVFIILIIFFSAVLISKVVFDNLFLGFLL